VFLRLSQEQLPLGFDKLFGGLPGWLESSEQIVVTRERCAQARDVELCREEIAVHVFDIGGADRWIELDENIPSLDHGAIVNVNRPHNPRFKRLDEFYTAGRNDLARCDRDDVDATHGRPCQRRAEQRNDGSADRACRRRGRGLDDFKGGWEESCLVVARGCRPHWEPDDVFDGGHWIPACSK
jgi:hypothetical protein